MIFFKVFIFDKFGLRYKRSNFLNHSKSQVKISVIFYSISTLVGYLMPSSVYIWFVSQKFEGNFIFKQVRTHLFAHSWMVLSIAI